MTAAEAFNLFDWQRTVLRQPATDLTSGQKNALVALGLRSDGLTGRNAFHGISALALACDLTARHVQTAIDRGQELGLIELTAPANKRLGRAAVYRLTFPDGHRHPVKDARTGDVKKRLQQSVLDNPSGATLPPRSGTTFPPPTGTVVLADCVPTGTTILEATGTNTPDLPAPQFHPSTATDERKGLRQPGTSRDADGVDSNDPRCIGEAANGEQAWVRGPYGPRCHRPQHVNSEDPPNCHGCRDARALAAIEAEARESQLREVIRNCDCDPNGFVSVQVQGVDAVAPCPKHPRLKDLRLGAA